MNLPAQIGRYQVVRSLGSGGMGAVFEVRDPALPDRRLALKQVHTHLANEASLLRFQREARALARIEHPNVLRVFECELSPLAYMVTDLIEGESLERLHGLGEVRSAEIVAQVASAVAAIHGHGLLHRDLKPENVILRPDGSPVLLDFGLVREHDGQSLTLTGEVLGTPSYMPPEQADGDKSAISERSDVYGLAAILFYLATGVPPYGPGSLTNVLFAVLEGEPNWSALTEADVSPELESIVRRGLARDPRARHASAADLAQDLQAFVASGGGSKRRSRGRAWAIGGAVLLASGLGVAGWWSTRSAQVTPTPKPIASAAPSAASPSSTPDSDGGSFGALSWRAFLRATKEREGSVTARAVLAYSKEARSGDDRVRALDDLRDRPLWRWTPAKLTPEGYAQQKGAIHLDAEQLLVWNGHFRHVTILNAETGEELHEVATPFVKEGKRHLANSVDAVSLGPSDHLVLIAERTGVFSYFRIVKGTPFEARLLRGSQLSSNTALGLALHPSGDRFALGEGWRGGKSPTGKAYEFTLDRDREVVMGKALPFAADQVERFHCIRYASDDTLVAVGKGAGDAGDVAFVWRSGKLTYHGNPGVGNFADQLVVAKKRDLFVYGTTASSLYPFPLAADLGTRTRPLAPAASDDPALGESQRSHTNNLSISALALSPDEARLYSACGPVRDAANSRLKHAIKVWRWSAAETAWIEESRIEREPPTPRGFQLSPDGQTLVAILDNGVVEAWHAPALWRRSR